MAMQNQLAAEKMQGVKKMKEYKMVYLNEGLNFSRKKDIQQAEDLLNKYVSEGWTLQQIVSPSDMVGAMVAVLVHEKYC